MKKSFIAATLIAAFVFASCEQSVLTGALPYGNAAVNESLSASNIAPQVVQPTAWVPFTPLPFTSVSGITSVARLATDGTYLVAAGYDRDNSIPYASRYDTVSGVWTTPVSLSSFFTVNPGAAHYLYNFFLVTGGTTSTDGAYSADGANWQPAKIGFGTKAGVYGPAEQLYVVAGQNGQAAYTYDLSQGFTTIPNTVTGWEGSGGPYYINAGAYGNGTYVFGGGSGRIAWTKTILDSNDDLVDWTEAETTPFAPTDFVDAIAYGCNTFVAVGDSPGSRPGIIAYSTDDGENWTLATYTTIGANAGIFTLAYADCYFTAIDDDGNAAYSTDGINWQPADDKAFIPGDSPQVNAVVYYDAVNAFVAGGQNAGTTQMGIADPLFLPGSGN